MRPRAVVEAIGTAPEPGKRNRALPPHPATVVQRRAELRGLPAAPQHAALAAPIKPSFASISPRLPHPATRANTSGFGQFGYSAAIQCMDRPIPEYSQCQTYKDLLRLYSGSKYVKPRVVILSTSLDGDHATLHSNCVNSYGGLEYKCDVLNASEIMYDAKALTLPNPTGNLLASLQKAAEEAEEDRAKKIILVVTSHGNVQWLFGSTPGQEQKATKDFATALRNWSAAVNPQLKVSKWISLIVLDACWSGSELLMPVNPKLTNSCPARFLSTEWGTVPVFGFNGKAAGNCVKYYKEGRLGSILKTPSYLENVVIFLNGEVLKGSGAGETLWHSSELMGNAFYQDLLFLGPPPPYFRSSSLQ